MGSKKLLYIQLAEKIQDRINNGELGPGDLVPSENELVKLYNMSRVTVRHAYKHLIDQGILRTIQGKGTYVNDVEEHDWTWMSSFTAGVLNEGHVPTTKIIDFKKIKAEDDLCDKLQIAKGTACFYFNRLRFIDNKPVWLTKTYIPCENCETLSPDYCSIAGVGQSLFTVLRQNFNFNFVFKNEIKVAMNIKKKDAQLLHIIENKPVISTGLIAYDDKNIPLLYENTIFEQSITKSPMRKFN
ncbi:MAG: GntR family transcriptional regulator [Pleomorphochaeta sp.]